MAGDAFGHDSSLRTVTSDAVRFHRHENIRSVATLHGMVTNVAIERRVRIRICLMFGVIEICLGHPAIDQNRLGNRRRGVLNLFDLVTKSTAREVRAC